MYRGRFKSTSLMPKRKGSQQKPPNKKFSYLKHLPVSTIIPYHGSKMLAFFLNTLFTDPTGICYPSRVLFRPLESNKRRSKLAISPVRGLLLLVLVIYFNLLCRLFIPMWNIIYIVKQANHKLCLSRSGL